MMKRFLLLNCLLMSGARAADIAPLTTHEVTMAVLADADSMTVYTFDKDVNGAPTCNGGCASVWPPIAAPDGDLKAPLGKATRADGTAQLTYKGKPIYLYAPDKLPGDIKGDGVGGVWHLVRP